MRKYGILGLILFISTTASAYFELGGSYSYFKRSFDSLDTTESQGYTASASFFFAERIALEFDYTNSLYVKKERENSITTASTSQRTTTQYSDIYESSLIYVFADHTATWQPFVKGGVAYINKKQVVQIDSDIPWEIVPNGAWAPSWGVGMKLLITDNILLRASYDVIDTPVDDNTNAMDINGKIGISWAF